MDKTSAENIAKYRHPLLFYGLSTLVPWAFWFAAAYFSHIETGSDRLTLLRSLLSIVGLLSPMCIALAMIFRDPELRRDFAGRLFNYRSAPVAYFLLTGFLMLASILAAQALSLLIGRSTNQFALAEGFSFTAGVFPAWFLLLLAPLVEELAWHSYGTDCLRGRMNLLAASILFGVFWAVWHMPLSFIKDYYHANLAESGLLYSVNFAVILIPYVIIMNWLYYKTGRNILVAVVFHITAGFFNEIFNTHPDSKVIQTGLLLVFSAVIVIREREFFLARRLAAPG